MNESIVHTWIPAAVAALLLVAGLPAAASGSQALQDVDREDPTGAPIELAEPMSEDRQDAVEAAVHSWLSPVPEPTDAGLEVAAGQAAPAGSCSGAVCVELTFITMVTDLFPAPSDTGDFVVGVEQGHLDVSVYGTTAQQPVFLAQVNGWPDGSDLDQSAGPVQTSYTRAEDVCVFNQCQFTLGLDPDSDALKVAELWVADLHFHAASVKGTMHSIPVVKLAR